MVTATQPTQHNTPCKTGAKENSRCLAVLVRMRSWTKGAHLLTACTPPPGFDIPEYRAREKTTYRNVSSPSMIITIFHTC